MKKKVLRYVLISLGGLIAAFVIILSGFFIAEPIDRKQYEFADFS